MPDNASVATSPSVFVDNTGVQVTWGAIAIGSPNTSSYGSHAVAIGSPAFSTSQELAIPAVAPEMPECDPEEEDCPTPMEEMVWAGPIAFEEQMTGDGRVFAPGAITWDQASLPQPFRWVQADTGGHANAVAVGRVDNIYRDPASPGTIFANGVVFCGENAPPEAIAFAALVTAGAAGGVSVDGDDANFTIVEAADGALEQHFSEMRLRGLTAVDIPAFIGARIHFTDGIVPPTDPPALVAGGGPVHPPAEWFDDPQLENPTPLTITADGRVYGHLAAFGTCHIAFSGNCVTPPRGNTYAYFHTGEIETADGECVSVGHLTFGTGHADQRDSALAAASHYDHTGTVAADVRAGEDDHGIWLAGAVRPHLSDEQVREFRAAPPSGDWRRIGGRLELVAALSVNVPGYPVPRERARVLVASGLEQSLIVAGIEPDAETARAAARTALAKSVRKAALADRIMNLPEEVVAWAEAERPSA